jgi:hypothetical protein
MLQQHWAIILIKDDTVPGKKVYQGVTVVFALDIEHTMARRIGH